MPCVLYDDLTGLPAEELSGLPQRVPHFPPVNSLGLISQSIQKSVDNSQCSLNFTLFKPDLVKFLSPLKMLLSDTSQLFTKKRLGVITVPFIEINDGSPFHYEEYDNNIPAEEDSIRFQYLSISLILTHNPSNRTHCAL